MIIYISCMLNETVPPNDELQISIYITLPQRLIKPWLPIVLVSTSTCFQQQMLILLFSACLAVKLTD